MSLILKIPQSISGVAIILIRFQSKVEDWKENQYARSLSITVPQ